MAVHTNCNKYGRYYMDGCFFWRDSPPLGQGRLIHEDSRSHTRRTTVGRTPLDEWSARRRDLYLTTHNPHNRQTSMPPVEFEPAIATGKRPQNYALARAATGTGIIWMYRYYIVDICWIYLFNNELTPFVDVSVVLAGRVLSGSVGLWDVFRYDG